MGPQQARLDWKLVGPISSQNTLLSPQLIVEARGFKVDWGAEYCSWPLTHRDKTSTSNLDHFWIKNESGQFLAKMPYYSPWFFVNIYFDGLIVLLQSFPSPVWPSSSLPWFPSRVRGVRRGGATQEPWTPFLSPGWRLRATTSSLNTMIPQMRCALIRT